MDIRPVAAGQAVLKYLAPYVYRVAISDNRILACDDESVTFRYTPSKKGSGTDCRNGPQGAAHNRCLTPFSTTSKSKTSKTRTVSGQEFVRGFLQHVLPRGFQKVRHYGWMSANCRTKRDLVRWLVWLFLGWTYWLASGHAPQPTKREPPQTPCPRCGATMTLIQAIIPKLGIVILSATGGRPQKARAP